MNLRWTNDSRWTVRRLYLRLATMMPTWERHRATETKKGPPVTTQLRLRHRHVEGMRVPHRNRSLPFWFADVASFVNLCCLDESHGELSYQPNGQKKKSRSTRAITDTFQGTQSAQCAPGSPMLDNHVECSISLYGIIADYEWLAPVTGRLDPHVTTYKTSGASPACWMVLSSMRYHVVSIQYDSLNPIPLPKQHGFGCVGTGPRGVKSALALHDMKN